LPLENIENYTVFIVGMLNIGERNLNNEKY